MLFDEPLTNLDAVLKADLLEMIRGLLRECGMTAVYVTHNVREACVLADRIAIVEAGRLVQIGTTDQLRAAPHSEFVGRVFGWTVAP